MHVTDREKLLLQAALNPARAVAGGAWANWHSCISMEEAPYSEARLLPAVYANLARIAPDLELPRKLRGKAKATFAQNAMHARAAHDFVQMLAPQVPTVIMKGLAACIRFDVWSSRPMGDADILLRHRHLETTCDLLKRTGWTPKSGMTWRALTGRSAARRESWGLTKDRAEIDIHWRVTAGAGEAALDRHMWSNAQPFELLGQPVQLPPPELSLVLSIRHGFVQGTRADALQSVIDAAALIRICDPELLSELLMSAQLMGYFQKVSTLLTDAGCEPAAARPAVARSRRWYDRRPRFLRARKSAHREAAFDRSLLRYPAIYRAWWKLGRPPAGERLLLRAFGPMSSPLASSGIPRTTYDLRSCAIVDEVGGPGWGSPELQQQCFWSDGPDARLLLPVVRRADHLVAISFSGERLQSPAPRVDVFANGRRLRTIDFRLDPQVSTYFFGIPARNFMGAWIELSFRPQSHVGDDAYFLRRSLPAERLMVFRIEDQLQTFLRTEAVPSLHYKVLIQEEPFKTKYDRIFRKIQASPMKGSADLPPDFDPVRYVLAYRDLFDAEVDPYQHYLAHGRKEERVW